MTKQRRRKFFYILVAIFAIIGPLLVAYSLGYTIDIADRDIKKTGGVFIKSDVPRLSIFLDGNFMKETSFLSGGALLISITPGVHLIRVEKSGYTPWSKTVSVEPENVTELRNVLPTQKPIPYATTTKTEISPIFPPKISHNFALKKNGDLVEKTDDTSQVIASNVNSFVFFEDTVFFIDKNGFLARFNLANKNIETIGRPGFYLSDNPIKATRSPKGVFAFLDSSGGIFILDETNIITPKGGNALNLNFDGIGEKMLIHKKQEIEIVWVDDNPRQPFQKKGDLNTILKLDSPVLDARWFYKNNAHIVIRTNDGIFFTELDGRGGRNTVELFTGKTDELLTGLEIPQAIFFRKGKTWYKIEL